MPSPVANTGAAIIAAAMEITAEKSLIGDEGFEEVEVKEPPGKVVPDKQGKKLPGNVCVVPRDIWEPGDTSLGQEEVTILFPQAGYMGPAEERMQTSPMNAGMRMRFPQVGYMGPSGKLIQPALKVGNSKKIRRF